jgi:sugar phosphate isomerase/epimerase
LEEGKSLADLRKRIGDLGLTVEGAIGFASWVVDDDAQRAKGLEQMKHDMDLVAQLGGRRIAAPPAGASGPIDFRKIAERYRAVLELGRRMGVVPQLEIWGTSKALSRPSEAALVAIEAAHSDACLLLDVFHMYRSGASFGGLRVINGACLHVFHMNDYPADPPREKATDADRIYPGDGIAPLASILRDLRAAGFRGALSLELFNRTYWKQDPLTVARTGLAKMKAAAEASLAVGKPGETK